MNKRQKEVLEVCLEDEKEVLGQLKANYTDALADIKLKIKNLQSNPLTQSKIYQIEYQQSLEKQISGILDVLNGNNFATISEYLEKSYLRGFVGNMYDLQGQGVPLTIPIDENQVVKCVSRTADGYKLSDKLGGNTEKLKKQVKAHIQRGIAAEKPYTEIARSISDEGEADINRSMRIVRTEGGRIQNAARLDAMNGAAKRGADVVKMWDSTLDGKTRSTHRELDGQIKELDEPFEVAGKKAPAPCNFGIAAEDCNCRCCVLQRARWAVDNPEFQKYKMDNETEEIIECKDYKEFEEKYISDLERQKRIRYDKVASDTDKEQFENYRRVLKENSPNTLAEFYKIKYNEPEKWSNLKYQYRTVNRYEIDGDVSVDKILELDQAAFYTKKKGFNFSLFTGKSKKITKKSITQGGNAAAMDFEEQIYFSHSKFGVPGTKELGLYEGKYPAVALKPEAYRRFSVKDLGDGIPREYDTEAKFLEFVAGKKNSNDSFTVTIISEKHICESCQGVVNQFREQFPNAKVNIISGREGYNKSEKGLKTWLHRKKVK